MGMIFLKTGEDYEWINAEKIEKMWIEPVEYLSGWIYTILVTVQGKQYSIGFQNKSMKSAELELVSVMRSLDINVVEFKSFPGQNLVTEEESEEEEEKDDE